MDNNFSNKQHDNDKLELLLELITQINSDLEIKSVLLNIMKAAKRITDSEACSVFLLDDDTDELILTIPTGPVSDKIHGKRFPKTQGIAGWVATHGKPQIVNDVSKDDRFYGDFEPEVFKTRNILCVPLKNQSEEVIGVLQAINKTDDAKYEESEISLFQALAHQAAIALTNAKLHDERRTLLSEIHHRVKNNMAIISGMIQLQAFSEANEILQNKLLKSVTRISSMAAVHEQLYESESFSSLNYAKNLKRVVEDTIRSIAPGQDISVSFECEAVTLNINQSIPCSLIVSEIIFHYVKYGFDEDQKRIIQINLTEDDEHCVCIKIRDNGTSIEEFLSDDENDQSGFRLIQTLSKQLEADYNYKVGESENVFNLKFKKSNRKGAGSHFL